MKDNRGFTAKAKPDRKCGIDCGEILINNRFELMLPVESLVKVAKHDETTKTGGSGYFPLLLGA